MKLKLDASGNAVLQDGKPIYVKEDGTEVAFDAASTISTISRLNGEAKGHRERAEKAEESLKAFEGLDSAAARKALETVQNLDNKKLIDAGEVDKVKAEIAKSYELKLADATKATQALEQQLHAEKIGGSFSRSKFIADKIAIPADMVQAAFGNRFALKDGKVVATGQDGNPIYSPSRPGELADFDEALEVLVGSYAHKDSILKGTGSTGTDKKPGSGSGGTGAKTMTRAAFEALEPSAKAQAMAEKTALTD
jgi:hypothetical protein